MVLYATIDLLIHGPQVIASALLPIDQMSEEPQKTNLSENFASISRAKAAFR